MGVKLLLLGVEVDWQKEISDVIGDSVVASCCILVSKYNNITLPLEEFRVNWCSSHQLLTVTNYIPAMHNGAFRNT